MLYSEIIAVCSQIHTKHINTLCGQNVPRTKHSVSVIKTKQLMLYGEIIAVCSQIHTKHTNTLCGQNVDVSNVKPGDNYCCQEFDILIAVKKGPRSVSWIYSFHFI
jgi:hypothetical protein